MADLLQKQFNVDKRDIKYINKDFASLKDALIEYSKTYFPTSYKDFTAASPGTMFMEQAAYVGDVLSYYIDYQFKESLLPYSEERKNVLALAGYLGYKTKPTRASNVTIDVYQLIPAIKDEVSDEYIPDDTYALSIREFMQMKSGGGVDYISTDSVDFAVDTKSSPRTATVYSRDSYGIPQFFLLKKTVNAISGKLASTVFTVTTPQQYLNIYLAEKNVIDVLDVRDSDNNKWYKTEYLAQDLIFTEEDNTFAQSGDMSDHRTSVSKLLKTLKTSRKFTLNVSADDITYLQFGPGTDNVADEIIYPTQDLVGVGMSAIGGLNISYDSGKLLKTNSLGQSPANTTLTISYIVGGGVLSNCASNDIKTIVSAAFSNDESGMTPSQFSLLKTVKNSLQITNSTPATGGADRESIDEIRQNAMAHFSAQSRTVTADDYVMRTYSLPARFGSIAKAYAVSNSNLSLNIKKNISGLADFDSNAVVENSELQNYFRKVNYDISNPFGINLYVLSYDTNKNLTTLNEAVLLNLQKYLEKHKIITDGINIIDGYTINIGIDFKISVHSNYNKRDVLAACITKVKSFFEIDKWGFNQPINITQLELDIANTDGVRSISSIKFKNLTLNDGNYSPYEYNLDQATKDKIVYPSLDPSVFEVKYPDRDIRGSCV